MNGTRVVVLTPEQVSVLARLAEAENTRLEDAASPVTHQAFNLGCLVGLVPGGIIVLLMYILIGFSFIGAAIALVLMLIGLLAFATWRAMLARRNTIRRVYHDQSDG
jgi:ABC-type nickel/cobalt efflux system permease component RcnA